MFEAGEMLHVAEAFIDKKYHPTVICRGRVCLLIAFVSCPMIRDFN